MEEFLAQNLLHAFFLSTSDDYRLPLCQIIARGTKTLILSNVIAAIGWKCAKILIAPLFASKSCSLLPAFADLAEVFFFSIVGINSACEDPTICHMQKYYLYFILVSIFYDTITRKMQPARIGFSSSFACFP